MGNTVNFLIGFGIFIVLMVVATLESVQSATQKFDYEQKSLKGDMGDLMGVSSVQKPVLSPPKWNDERLTSTFASQPTHKNKGDLGVLDPRGTVRYNFMTNGRIGRGSITSLADDEHPITQATGSCCKMDTYAPIL